MLDSKNIFVDIPIGLANSKAMLHNKKTQKGFTERIEILLKFWKPAEQAIAQAFLWGSPLGINRDDVVDALVLAVVASFPNSQLVSIPKQSQFEEVGLPMEIVCPYMKLH
jgi:predicted RNase H-like nuclease